MKLFNKDKLPSSEAIRYAEKQTKIYKQQVIKATNDYIQLQSNWNSLREFVTLKEKPKVFGAKNGKTLELAIDLVFDMVLNKMNELEGGDND